MTFKWIRRILARLALLFWLLIFIFLLVRLSPGNPFDTDQVWPPEIQATIEKKYGLDQPLVIQLFRWLKNCAQGDLGESFQYGGIPVRQIIAQSFPISAFLGISALCLSFIIGIALGILCVWERNSLLEQGILAFCVSTLSIPPYVLASLFIWLFALHLHWLPAALWEDPLSWVLPTLSLSLRPIAMLTRLTRNSLLETLQADFIRTAQAKGLSHFKIFYQHALKNSLIPILSILGPMMANLVTGSFIIETVFQISGMGRYFVQSVLNRDYPLIMGISAIYGVVLILSNLFSDLLLSFIDPRIRVSESS